MNIYNPLALIGLISLPVIIAMYLFKTKYKEKEISSLFLWKNAIKAQQSMRPWQKLRKNLLMILQLLAAFFLVSALANPYIMSAKQVSRYIVVLDCSMSMQAEDEAPNRFEAAKQKIADYIENSVPGTEFALIEGSNQPRVISGFTDSKTLLDERLKEIGVTYSDINLEGTAELINMLNEQNQAGVLVFSDTAHNMDKINKQDIIIGKPILNTALTLISHTHDKPRVVVLVKVKNYGNQTENNSVELYTDGKIHDIIDISLEPQQERDVFFTDVPDTVYQLEARLSKPDKLPADNVIYDAITYKNPQKTVLVTDRNYFLENILSLLPNVELYKSADQELFGANLYVFDGILPEALPTDGHLLIINPPEGNSLIETQEEVEISGLQKNNSQLLQNISNFDFAIGKSKKIVAPDWAEVVLSSPETPLIICGEKNGQKITIMGFDLHNTDLPLKREFPIFMYNLAEWYMPGVIAAGKAFCGEALSIELYPDTKSAVITDPNNQTTEITPPVSPTLFSATENPGIYILQQVRQNETVYSSFALNAVKTDSDLTGQSNGVDEVERLEFRLPNDFSLKGTVIFVILSILLLEWWVFSRVR